MKKICLKCRRVSDRGTECACGGRIVRARNYKRGDDDSKLLDYLERVTDEGGYWATMSVHDSRDMGYNKDFVSVSLGNRNGKGNSFREALRNLIECHPLLDRK